MGTLRRMEHSTSAILGVCVHVFPIYLKIDGECGSANDAKYMSHWLGSNEIKRKRTDEPTKNVKGIELKKMRNSRTFFGYVILVFFLLWCCCCCSVWRILTEFSFLSGFTWSISFFHACLEALLNFWCLCLCKRIVFNKNNNKKKIKKESTASWSEQKKESKRKETIWDGTWHFYAANAFSVFKKSSICCWFFFLFSFHFYDCYGMFLSLFSTLVFFLSFTSQCVRVGVTWSFYVYMRAYFSCTIYKWKCTSGTHTHRTYEFDIWSQRQQASNIT